MYKIPKFSKTSIEVNKSVIGETIETQVERLVNNRENISGGSPLIFTERKDGVLAEYNIRTDRFEVAIDAMDKVSKSYKARRESKADIKVVNNDEDGRPESIQGKSQGDTAK